MVPRRELIPYSVISSLRNQLSSSSSSSCFDDFARIYGVQDQLESINSCVESIELLLGDGIGMVEEEEEEESQEWITSLKRVLLPTNDFFENIAAQILLKPYRPKVLDFFSLSSNPLVSRLGIRRQMNNMQKDFCVIMENLFNLTQRGGPKIHVRPVTTSSNFVESDHIIIGREDEKMKIVSMLLEEDTDVVSSIAIVGLGGIGKTTLAQMVYNNAQVEGFFEKKVWFHVSHSFDVQAAAKQILHALFGDDIDEKREPFEQYSLLPRTRYLLVLDDVWNLNCEKWNQLTSSLMCGAIHGTYKILLTTRCRIVAEEIGVNSLFHLNGLSFEDSFNLLKMLALSGIDSFDKDNDGYPILEMLEPIDKCSKVTYFMC